MENPEQVFRDKVVGSLERIETKQDFMGEQITALNATVPDLRDRISKIEGARGAVKTVVVSVIAVGGVVVSTVLGFLKWWGD